MMTCNENFYIDEIWVEHRKSVEIEKEEEDHSNNFSDQFRTLLQSGNHADIKFLIGENKEEVPCHKAILAARSEYFNAMFRSKFL
jgi:hypothetical protein